MPSYRVVPSAFVVGLALLGLTRPALADPNDYVLTLDITAGEREFDAKLGAASSAPDGAPAREAAALAWGVGITNAWFTEAYLQFANSGVGPSGMTGGVDGVSLENVVRFDEPGEWPVDLGATLEIERPRAAAQGWKFTLGPMLQADWYALQINANLLLSRVVGAQDFSPTQLRYQFQARYRSHPLLDVGVQALGDMGPWNHWGAQVGQSHRLGPALFGRYRLGPGRAISYNAALLLGTSRGAPDTTLRAQVDIEY